MSQYFIGLSTSGHDPAFSIADSNGRIIFAEASERFLQVKRAWGSAPDHTDHVVPVIEKIIEADSEATFVISTSWTRVKQDLTGDGGSVIASPFSGIISPKIGRWMMGIQAQIHTNSGHNILSLFEERVTAQPMHFDHHQCHAVNAVYTAPFEDGLVLVVDGEGEVGSISLFRMKDRMLKRLWRSWGPGSLGTFYCWLTSLCGFNWVAGEEWKVMGLAAYGTPNLDLAEQLSDILAIEDGRPVFAEHEVVAKVESTLQPFQRSANEPVESAANLAATGQLVYQRYMNSIISSLQKYDEENLVLSGGCALNSSYNGYLVAKSLFKQIHVPPAPADDGNAIGAALLAWAKVSGNKEISKAQGACYLGSFPDRKAITNTVNYSGWNSISLVNGSPKLIAEELAKGKIIGVFRGAAEFGPRALGHRSILADPRSGTMKDTINLKVKGREAYRPFAPMILEEHQSAWFEVDQYSPYMSFALPFRKDKAHLVPAVVHADGTGRAQTISQPIDPWLYELVSEFFKLTGVPILLNTSFNVMGKPIVHSVQDAVSVFGTSGLDGLLLEDVYFSK
ncbi:carbamoyltransferase [Shewanella waksmanii]|uniref:carbamoyltransferase family protein n=1 Tax=Shewanella waksmanii TaxID=213783 RepID=UPI0037352B6D